MNRLSVRIENVQHIGTLALEIDLSIPGIYCLVGRNGAGKTTLVRALRNLSNADTFVKTAPPHIFRNGSLIRYEIDGYRIDFSYDARLRTLNTRDQIPPEVRNVVSAELSIPHGARFNFSKSASLADEEIRRAIALESASKPAELIAFLNEVYGTDRYQDLIEVQVKGKPYYAAPHTDGTYLREDYLSSGEHFLINLYKTVKSDAKLLVIDEIDLSLDAAAQAKLAGWLRTFCHNYRCRILFTTHSLAIMKTMAPDELAYLECTDSAATITPASYSYVKARLFGFSGWDRYILTEDKVLLEFLELLIARHCPPSFFSYKIIYIGGGSQVADLLARNATDEFLGQSKDVIAVLDGDRRAKSYASAPSVLLTPMENLEDALYQLRETDGFPFPCERKQFSSSKDFFVYLQQKRIATSTELCSYLIDEYRESLDPLLSALTEFLARPSSSDAAEVTKRPSGALMKGRSMATSP